MKAILNDGTELTVQQVKIIDRVLCIKTISVTQEQLRQILSDTIKTKKIIIQERGQTTAEYEKYTVYEGTMVYAGGILEAHLQKEGETTEEILQKLKEQNEEFQRQCNELAEQNEMLQGCILEMSEMVYQ